MENSWEVFEVLLLGYVQEKILKTKECDRKELE